MENKTSIYSILDQSYAECHDIITNHLKDDLNTLYSCIRVNRSFCRIFIPILWKNPFKFINDENEERLIEIINTLIHCLDSSDKLFLVTEKLIRVEDLPATPKAYFKYNTLIKDFELNSLQKGMRLWTSKYFANGSSGKKVSKRVRVVNDYLGRLLFNGENQYDSLNVYYNDLLMGPDTLLNICGCVNHEKCLVRVDTLSLGFFSKNSTDLVSLITKNFLSLQNALSPNIQHLQISVDTTKHHSQLSNNLIDFIQFQHNLKSLIISPFCNRDDFNNYYTPLLNALKTQSNSLTFLKLKYFSSSAIRLVSILKSLPNLITLEIDLVIDDDDDDDNTSKEILTLSIPKLEHLNYFYRDIPNNQTTLTSSLFKQILLLSSNTLKSLKVKDSYCSFIKEVQLECLLNLTHFHLETKNYKLVDLIHLLKNLHQLIHLKLSVSSNTTSTLNFISTIVTPTVPSLTSNSYEGIVFKKFSQALPPSLKILEIDSILEKYLKILLNESQFNLQCIKLYDNERVHYGDALLRIFIDYEKKKKCFRELGISHIAKSILSESCIREAKNYFNITINNKIDDPFYDVPINNSYWSGNHHEKKNSEY